MPQDYRQEFIKDFELIVRENPSFDLRHDKLFMRAEKEHDVR